ncbi:MAG: winged helix-turn-helix transcriptional regulator [Calothrix sp. SM1_5_4]|nr:winged helix-turn-helix transcriptional regulator [Calothrix sp. SM1_5_4]
MGRCPSLGDVDEDHLRLLARRDELQAEICAALANPVRLEILDLVSSGEKTAAELLKELNIPKANLSQHLSVLKDAGLLRARKEGLYQYVSLAIPKIKDACSLVRSLLIEKVSKEEKLASDLMRALKNRP